MQDFIFLHVCLLSNESDEQEEKLCNEGETVREFAYLVDRVSAGG